MAFEVTIPRLGWSMEKGTFVEWRKKDGEEVRQGDFIFVIEGDKAEQEVEALESGTLRILPDGPAPGQEVPVGLVIGYLLTPGERMPDLPATASRQAISQASPQVPPLVLPQTPRPHLQSTPLPTPQPTLRSATRRVAASPRARRVAVELGVDWHGLTGSGKTGRIVERDVREAVKAAVREAAQAPGSAPGLGAAQARGSAPMTGIGRAFLSVEVDVTELADFLERLSLAPSAFGGAVPTLDALLVKLASAALSAHPEMEALVKEALIEQALVTGPRMDVACAIDSPSGPLFRTVTSVDSKSVSVIAAELGAGEGISSGAGRGLAFLAVANLGKYGVDTYIPARDLPWPLLLTLGQIGERGSAMLGLSFAESAVSVERVSRFLERARAALEQPLLWLAM